MAQLLSGPSSDWVEHVHAADLDDDGLEDLVIASRFDERLVWHRSLPGGGHGPASVIAEGALRVTSLAHGDLDNDGDVDLVVSASRPSSAPPGRPYQLGVLWFEALGGGAFLATPRLVIDELHHEYLGNVGLVDVEGDGDLDVVCIGTGSVLLARMVGTDFAPPQWIGAVQGFGPRSLAVGDLDGDGLEDLLVTALAYGGPIDFGTVWRFQNLGGAFASQTSIGSWTLSIGLAIEDLDGDGDRDVLIGRGDRMIALPNDGFGGLGAPMLLNGGQGAARIEARDVDADGDTDIAFAQYLGHAEWMSQTGPMTFSTPNALEQSLPHFTLADFDGDGDVDLAGGGPNRLSAISRENLGAGTFGPPRALGAPAVLAPKDVLLVDLDLDGDLDALACGEEDGRVVWFEGNSGILGAAMPVGVVPGARRLAAGDLDGDGDVDVVAIGAGAYWFARQGAGFGPAMLLRDSANDAVPADMDADGDLDVVIGSTDAIRWRVNQGGGSFGPDVMIAPQTRSSPGDVEVADIFGSGNLDVIATGYFAEPVIVVPNLGGGQFGSKMILPAPSAYSPPNRIGAADLDGDGLLDLISGGFRYYWMRSVGGGMFDAATAVGPYFGSSGAFATADVDGDGDTDFVHASYTSWGGQVTWLENDMGNLGALHLVTDRAQNTWGIAAGDVDMDGDADILTASWADHSVLVHENAVARVSYYCAPAVANSTGLPGRIEALWSFRAAENRLRLAAFDLPSGTIGYFITSRTQGFSSMPGSRRGNLCLGGAIGRFAAPGQLRTTGAGGSSFMLAADLAAHPTPTGAVTVSANETWYFQAWYRDVVQGASTSNFTDAVGVWFE